MLKTKYASSTDIPEQYKDLYTESNDGYALTGIEGLKSQEDVDRIHNSLRKEREERKAIESTLSIYKRLGDVNDVQASLDRIHELEATNGGAIDEAKMEEIVTARLKSKLAPVERQLAAISEEKAALELSLTDYQLKDKRRLIHDHIRKAAVTAKVRDTAMEDALLIGENVFTIDEDNRVITKDNVGVTPGIDATVWLSEVKAAKPHWWPESVGAGATGGASGSYSTNPFSKDGWNMTEQGRLVKDNPEKAAQMAKSAGTTVGGPKPA